MTLIGCACLRVCFGRDDHLTPKTSLCRDQAVDSRDDGDDRSSSTISCEIERREKSRDFCVSALFFCDSVDVFFVKRGNHVFLTFEIRCELKLF